MKQSLVQSNRGYSARSERALSFNLSQTLVFLPVGAGIFVMMGQCIQVRKGWVGKKES